MLSTLRLRHFVLIDECTISFEKGLNILTGETGAGKTILIQAINLLMGQKADPSIIRSGEEKATIEAIFDIDHLSPVFGLLEEAGIRVDLDEPLIIRREVSRSAKNRIFISAEAAPLQLLSKLSELLFEVAGQNASAALRSPEEQRKILDIYGNIDVPSFTKKYEEAKKAEKTLELLQRETQNIDRKIQQVDWELKDLQSIDHQEDEEALFAMYKEESGRQHLINEISEIVEGLTHPESPLIPSLTRYKKKLENLPTLHEAVKLLETSLMNLNEVSYTLSSYQEELNENLANVDSLEKKLTIISQIKKKYHLELHEVPERINELENTLVHYRGLDDKINEAEKIYKEASVEIEKYSQKLRKQRTETALSFGKALTAGIQLLNMADASFHVHLSEKEIGPEGADMISFALSANLGENPSPLKNKASGGELSRLFFTLKLLLAEKESIPTVIFDEIDSNIGGETATLFGEKLELLSQFRQVLCITHFPQVARFATHHLKISKKRETERTVTTIEPLDSEEKQEELLRMMGGKPILT